MSLACECLSGRTNHCPGDRRDDGSRTATGIRFWSIPANWWRGVGRAKSGKTMLCLKSTRTLWQRSKRVKRTFLATGQHWSKNNCWKTISFSFALCLLFCSACYVNSFHQDSLNFPVVSATVPSKHEIWPMWSSVSKTFASLTRFEPTGIRYGTLAMGASGQWRMAMLSCAHGRISALVY